MTKVETFIIFTLDTILGGNKKLNLEHLLTLEDRELSKFIPTISPKQYRKIIAMYLDGIKSAG